MGSNKSKTKSNEFTFHRSNISAPTSLPAPVPQFLGNLDSRAYLIREKILMVDHSNLNYIANLLEPYHLLFSSLNTLCINTVHIGVCPTIYLFSHITLSTFEEISMFQDTITGSENSINVLFT